MQTIAASPDPNPALESETAALALEAAVTLSDAGEQTGHATADKPSESPATSEKPAESPEVLSLSAPAQEKTPPSILEDLQPASASECESSFESQCQLRRDIISTLSCIVQQVACTCKGGWGGRQYRRPSAGNAQICRTIVKPHAHRCVDAGQSCNQADCQVACSFSLRCFSCAEAAYWGWPQAEERLCCSRSRVGKHELRALLEGTGNNPAAGEQGSFATLSPMRTPAHLRSTLGPSQVCTQDSVIDRDFRESVNVIGYDRLWTLECAGQMQVAVTPVRRSARKSMAPSATPSALLQRSGYSFVPNTALEAKFGKDAMVGATDGLGAFKEVSSSAVKGDLADAVQAAALPQDLRVFAPAGRGK